MDRIFKTAAVMLVMIAPFATTLYSQSPAADGLNLGIQANNQAKYEKPIWHCAIGIAFLQLNMKKCEDAKKHYQMTSGFGFDRRDPQPYYSIGVIDWTECYQSRMEEQTKLGVKRGENLNPKNKKQKRACDELRIKNAAIIEEGIDSLNTAIQVSPDYDDAMAYLNLMYREKADLECHDPAARAEDLRTADEWLDRTLAVKKATAEKSARPPSATAPNPQ